MTRPTPTRARALRFQQGDDLAGPRVTAELGFFEDRYAGGHNLEPSASRGNQVHVDGGIVLTNLSRQTDGPRFVVSHHAVFDGDGHGLGKKRS